MKVLKIFLLLAILSVSLYATSFHTRELKEELRQWKKEKMLRDARKNILASNELSTSLEFYKLVGEEKVLKRDTCTENDRID